MKKQKINLAIKLLAIFLIFSLALILVMGYIWKTLKRSDYFRIKDIITREGDSAQLAYLKGRNIFSIDFKSESRNILEFCPECASVRLVRVLPDRLFVDFIKRRPVALVKLYKYFSLDENGVFFSALGQSQESELPVIVGLETKIFGAKPGRRYNNRELALALDILRETARNRGLKNYKLKKIDVSNFSNASIIIIPPQAEAKPEGLEVKLGADNIEDKITTLANLLGAARNDLSNIKYIDLKFREPVIKFNDAKKDTKTR
jgi:cell division septal protein FtsQ